MKWGEKIFMVVVAICSLMSSGPGIALVNGPRFIGPYPIIYLWTILWFVIFGIAILIAAYTVWEDDDDRDSE
mgnify:CR=1 FL=1